MIPKKYRCNGEELSMLEWSRRVGIRRKTIEGRLNRGWSLEKALTVPVKKRASQRYRYKDHVGERHGLLTVVKRYDAEDTGGGVRWLCKCKCGGLRIVYSKYLNTVKDCGCGSKKRKGPVVPNIEQPCWSCQNYIDGCSWSRKEHLPVEGWDAVPTLKYQGRGGEMRSYAIISCPEYVSDGTEGRG